MKILPNKINIGTGNDYTINDYYKTIAEVGYTVGFNSSSNFIRVFKSLEGMSPKAFVEEGG